LTLTKHVFVIVQFIRLT